MKPPVPMLQNATSFKSLSIIFSMVVLSLLMHQLSAAEKIAPSTEPDIPVSQFSLDTTFSFSGIMAALESSTLHYQITPLPDSDQSLFLMPTMRHNNYYQTEDDSGGIAVYEYRLTDSVEFLCTQAGEAITRHAYDSALELQRRAYLTDTSVSVSSTYLGNIFYMMGAYDSAIFYFHKAIAMNFIDYQAHWFLADAYRQLGMGDSVITEMILAHVLNIGHFELFNDLRARRELTGRPWRFTDFRPQYKIEKSNDTVFVTCHTRWFGYCALAALWKFEPGYADKLSLNAEIPAGLPPMESYAVIAQSDWDTTGATQDMILEVLNAGFFGEFLWYEIMLHENPALIMACPPEAIHRIAEYVDRFH